MKSLHNEIQKTLPRTYPANLALACLIHHIPLWSNVIVERYVAVIVKGHCLMHTKSTHSWRMMCSNVIMSGDCRRRNYIQYTSSSNGAVVTFITKTTLRVGFFYAVFVTRI